MSADLEAKIAKAKLDVHILTEINSVVKSNVTSLRDDMQYVSEKLKPKHIKDIAILTSISELIDGSINDLRDNITYYESKKIGSLAETTVKDCLG